MGTSFYGNVSGGNGSSGSGLPAVTGSDNGNVLTVVEGAWAKAAPSGGVLVVHGTMGEEYAVTLDKTFAEIRAFGGPAVLFLELEENGFEIMNLVSSDSYGIEFVCITHYSTAGYIKSVNIDSENNIVYYASTFTVENDL